MTVLRKQCGKQCLGGSAQCSVLRKQNTEYRIQGLENKKYLPAICWSLRRLQAGEVGKDVDTEPSLCHAELVSASIISSRMWILK